MFSDNGKISRSQLFILLFFDIFGAGTYGVRGLIYDRNGSGWLAVLIVGVIIAAFICLALLWIKPFEWRNLPPVIKIPFAFLFVCKMVFVAGLLSYTLSDWLNGSLMPHTPPAALRGALILACCYAAAKGIEGRARLAQLVCWAAALPLALAALAFFVGNPDVKDLAVNPYRLKSGVLAALPMFGGAEFALIASGKVRGGKAAFSAGAALLTVALSFALLSAAAVARLGIGGAAAVDYPAIDLLGDSNAITASLWTVSAFLAEAACLFAAGDAIVGAFLPKDAKKSPPVYVCGLLGFAVSLLPANALQAEILRNIAAVAGLMLFAVVLPLVYKIFCADKEV